MLFLLDENAHWGLKAFLAQLGHDVELSPKGLTNGKVLALAISKKRVLITHDADFSKEMITRNHPGIVLVRILPKYFEKIKASMRKLLEEKKLSFDDKLFLLFEDRYEEVPFRFEETKP